MSLKKIGLGAALAASAVAIVIGGSALANADTPSTTGYNSTGSGYGAPEGRGGPGGPDGSDGPSHTAVTGAELTKVTAAMKAKDSAVTVTAVRKDADGSYDVLGTKAGAPVMYDVSADLATFTAHTGGPGGARGHGGPEGSPSSPATGSSGTATAPPSA